MKRLLTYIFIVAVVGCAGGGYEKATDPQDAGREFIRASLDGDHKKARFFLLQDSTNLLLMNRQEKDYDGLSHDEKNRHRESSIRPVAITRVNDTTTAYRYYNTYNPKDTTSISVVKNGDHWLVDLKSILTR